MEVCGGQNYTIVKTGLQDLLPEGITLVHGPGCPVCVTPVEMIDRAVAIANRSEVILCSFGDMLRVPGSTQSLLDAKALGADVRIVYSPLDALHLARSNPKREVVFFAVGFETTAPANAMAVWEAERQQIQNFSMLVSHVLVPPAMEAILSSPDCRVQAFLAAGHVCMVMGFDEYVPISQKYHVPIVVTGFEPLDLLEGVQMAVSQLESGRAEVENQYARAVRRSGNRAAQGRIAQVFEITRRAWRGIGEIPASGLRLRAAYRDFDAESRFPVDISHAEESCECIAGLVLRGQRKTYECPALELDVRRIVPSERRWFRRKAHARLTFILEGGKKMAILSCLLPRPATDRILLAHGGGGRLTNHLIESVFLSAFSNFALESRHDGAVFSANGGGLAMTTDTYVVQPLVFPGGTIGDLAVNGTVNDLAMCGARPLALSAGFVLEEGLSMDTLRSIVASMAKAARVAKVPIVTGDTKVVDKGKGD